MNNVERQQVVQALLSAASLLSGNALTRIKASGWENLDDEKKLNLLAIVFNAIGLDAWEQTADEELPEGAGPDEVLGLFSTRLSQDSLVDKYIPWLANKMTKATDDEVRSLVRGFRAVCQWAHETKTDIGPLSVADALAQGTKYVPRAARRALEDSDENPVVYRFSDGYRVVNLRTDEALKLEGQRMKHCVGNYCGAVKSGTSVIYSLRSPDNDPEKCLTLEYQPEGKTFTQMFGPGNRDPKPEQRKYLVEFLEAKYPEDKMGLLLAGKKAKDIDFSSIDLQMIDLKGRNLSGANLAGASLEGKDLTFANLTGVNLAGADLTDAHLRDAVLMEANLAGANLTGASLRSTNLQEADLENADLTDTYLVGARLKDANLRGAKLVSAKVERANFMFADLTTANLTGANAEEANFEGAKLEGARLAGTELTRCRLVNANLQGANLRSASLARAHIISANLENANLEDARLEFADLTGANMKSANLSNADLEGADLTGANLSNANLQFALLDGADLKDTNLDGADLTHATFDNAWYNDTTVWPAGLIPEYAIKASSAQPTAHSIAKIRAANTEIPAPTGKGTPKPRVFNKAKKTGQDEFTIESDNGKKITLLADIQATLNEVAELLA